MSPNPRSLLLVGVTALLLLASCRRDRDTTGTPGNPFVLVVSPAHATPASAQQLEAALSASSGLTIRVQVASSGIDAVRSAGTQRVDAGLLPVFEYLLARQEYDVEAGLQVVRGESREYAGVLLVRADSPVQTLAELAGRKIAFVDQTSTTGHLLAVRTLARLDVEYSFAGSHDAAVAALEAGSVDAAATYAAPRAGTRVLADTGAVPNEPVFFSPKVPSRIRERVARALTELAATPTGRALLEGLAGISGFAPVTDEAYRPVHDLLRETARDLPDLVPGGRELVEWNRVPLDVYSTI